MSENSINNNNRIFYVEPNDVYGDDEYQVVPYEDLCISFNLTCEIYDRRGAKINGKGFVITCHTDAVKKQNFLQGMGKFNNTFTLPGDEASTFLTTYYSEVSGNDKTNEQIIEGLGIESMNISFENYYAPRVQIKFVDVRGASLFGREETIHNEAGDITGENVFGAFFTIPYPKFRLQIKGFYGRPVTFQLTCESFKGNFNSSNGNFEANVTFIGYQYSLMTDLPMRYLIAAPLQEYYGREYWDKHVNTPEWQLTDNKPPITLFEFANSVRTAIMEGDSTKGGMTPEEEVKLNELSDFKGEYGELQQCYDNLVTALRNNEQNGGAVRTIYSQIDDSEECEEILLMYSSGTKGTAENEVINTFNKALTVAQNDLINRLREFNKSVREGTVKSRISTDDFVEGKDVLWAEGYKITTKKYISKTIGSDGKLKVQLSNGNNSNGGYYDSLDILDEDFSVGGVSLTQSMREELKYVLNEETDPSKIGEYWYVIDLRKLNKIITEGMNRCTERIDDISNSPSPKNQIDYEKLLGFTPTIGNIFKIVMCHLETFCHIMFSVANQIDSKHRTPQSLPFSLENTDISTILPEGEQTIGPFPGVMNNGISENGCGDINEGILRRAWVGDFDSHPFLDEENVVKGFIRAVQSVAEEIQRQPNYIISGKKNLESMALLPSDMLTSYNDFIVPSDTNVDNAYISILAGQLGFRIANIFGILNGGNKIGNDAKLYGELDALNYYMSLRSSEKLSEFIIGNKGDNLGKRLLNIMLCNEEGQPYTTKQKSGGEDKRHAFETNKVSDEYSQTNRHPMFVTTGGDYKYCHYYDKNGVSLVPSYITDKFDYYSSYTKEEGDAKFRMVDDTTQEEKDKRIVKVHFEPRLQQSTVDVGLYNGDEFMYCSNDYPIVQTPNNGKEHIYENTMMFDIRVPSSDAEADEMLSLYRDFTEETSKDAFDYTADISKYKSLYEKHWKLNRSKFNASFAGYGTEMYCENMSSSLKKRDKYKKRFDEKDEKCDKKTFNENSTRKPFSEYYIHELNVNDYNKSKICESIFAHEIYYMQNENNDTTVRNRCKLLLLLHCLKYNKPSTNNWYFINKAKKCGTIEALPYGQVLLLGGLLWRQRLDAEPFYYKEKGTIEYYGFDKNKTLFNSNGDFVIYEQSGQTYQSIKDYFGVDATTLDYHYQNKLIALFESFADRKFNEYFGNLEIKTNDNKPFNGNGWRSIKYAIVDIYDKVKKKQLKANEAVDKSMAEFIRETTNIFKNGTDASFDSLVKYYMCINFDKRTKRFCLLINDDEDNTDAKKVQRYLRFLYARDIFIYDSLGKFISKGTKDSKNGVITVDKSDLDSYLDGFADMLVKINKEKNNVIPDQAEVKETTLNPETYSREMAIDIYYYLKNIWDKWLIVHHREGSNPTNLKEKGQEYFNVENFFTENFIFIDKFYLNIFKLLICNASKVTDAISDIYSNRDASLFSFLSQICSDHGCMLFAMPDFINFGRNIKEGSDALIDAFRAYPYSKIGKPREENKFVVMYADHPSDTATDKTGYRTDCFDIKPTEDNLSIPPAFKSVDFATNSADADNNMKVYGYGVPAFGLSFGRQKQSIFKNINVNMNNPMTTSISIQATTDIANMGKDSGRKVYFQGQDTFSIYSNYSYECEVDMMGDAQIMPLMYFQLMNVPLWRGAYMIYKVTHTITPGDMTTHFVGQKLSKISTPWCTKYAVKAKDTIGIDGSTPQRNENYVGNYEFDPVPQETVYEPHIAEESFDDIIPCNEYEQGVFVNEAYKKALTDNIYISELDDVDLYMGKYALRCELAKMYLSIRDEYENACNKQYTVCLSSAVREKKGNSTSEHNGPYSNREYAANAIDFQIADIKTHKKYGKKLYKEIFRLMDVILNNHFNEIGQLIIEPKGGEYATCFTDGTQKYKNETNGYNCLHLSCGNKTSSSKYKGNKPYPMIFLSNGKDYKSVKFRNGTEASKNCAPEFLAIAGKFYGKIGFEKFKKYFLNFQNLSNDELETLFKEFKTNSTSTKGTYNTSDDANKYGVENTKVFHEVVKYLGFPYSSQSTCEVVRDSKTKYPIIDDSERAILADKVTGMNAQSLITNICKDLSISEPSYTLASCVNVFSNTVTDKSQLKAGDIIVMKEKNKDKISDIMMYLGNDKVVKADNKGVEIIKFSENEKMSYSYKRHPSIGGNGTDNTTVNPTAGNETEKRVWKMLTEELHFTPEAAAGFMGNIKAESGMRTNNVVNRCPYSDEKYTEMANTTMTRSQFANDGYAYGLCQWLFYSRKGNLWDYTRGKEKNIDDLNGQLALLKNEINGTYYSSKLKPLINCDSVYDSTIRVMVCYEAPSYNECKNSEDKRYNYALEYYKLYMGKEKSNDKKTLYYTQSGNKAVLV